MYCKNCRFRQLPNKSEERPYCSSDKLVEYDYEVTFESDGDRLIYSYSEGGRFYVEDNFGCVHFEPADSATWKDLIDQAESAQKRASAIETRLRDIRERCVHPNLPPRQLGEEYMDVCPDCGFISYCYSI